MVFLPYAPKTRVRIRRVPPTGKLEGIDLTAYAFKNGMIYDVRPEVATVLLVWGYAEVADGSAPEPSDESCGTVICPTCGSGTSAIGESQTPRLIHYHCDTCGRITSQVIT
jgi:hypothetical protein